MSPRDYLTRLAGLAAGTRFDRLTAIGAGADEVMLQVLARLDGYSI